MMDRSVKGSVSIGIALALLLASIAAGSKFSRFSLLSPFGLPPVLDYSAGPNGFGPLDARYIADSLGRAFVEAGREGRADPRDGSSRAGRRFVPPGRVTDHHALSNDRRASAREVPAVPFTARTDTRGAGREAGEPDGCSRIGGTVWYRYSATADRGMIANTFGTERPVALGVFRVEPDGSVEQIGCDTDINGNAVWQFAAQRSRTYLFQVSAPAGGGDTVFSLEMQGRTDLVTANDAGRAGNGPSGHASVSDDGRYIAYHSYASDVWPGGDSLPCAAHERGQSVGTTLNDLLGPDQPCSQAVVFDRRTGKHVVASVNDAGELSNGHIYSSPEISGDGRYLAFVSTASNLVPNDTNHIGDVFLRDLEAGTTERVTHTFTGAQVEFEPDTSEGGIPVWGGSPFELAMSGDGRFVAYASSSSSLVRGDTNGMWDIFVWDRITKVTRMVSVASDGTQGDDWSRRPCFSRSGRYIAFSSHASTLVPNDRNGSRDVFVHDMRTGKTTLESVSETGEQGNGSSKASGSICMSDDGRMLAFLSDASNLVPDDTNGITEVLLRDRRLGTLTRVNVSSSGEQSQRPARPFSLTDYTGREGLQSAGSTGSSSVLGSISGNGQYVVYASYASNLVPEDNNGNRDVFLYDTETRTTVRVSLNTAGDPYQGTSSAPAISADGAVIVFDSHLPFSGPLEPNSPLASQAMDASAPLQVWVLQREGSFR